MGHRPRVVPKLQCGATNRRGTRCAAVVGATVCDRHAGKAPHVVDAATVRLTVAELRVRPKQCVGPQAASPSQHGERVSVHRQCTQFVRAAQAPERPIWRHDARLIGARRPYRSDGAAGVVARYVESVAPGGSSRGRSTESTNMWSGSSRES